MELSHLTKIITEEEPRNLYNLAIGYTGEDVRQSLCELFKGVAERTLEKELSQDALIFQYGSATGSEEWKIVMARYLTQAYGSPVIKDNLVLTCGSHHGLHLVLSTLLDLNGVVFIDELTYTYNLSICRQFSSMELIPVAFDSTTGVDFADLQCKVKSKRFAPCKGKLFWGVYLTMSVFHNPTGVTYNVDLCAKLVELAQQEEMLIVSDDASNLLNYNFPDKPPKRLFAYDDFQNSNFLGNIVSISTYSKVIGAGIRLGWMECSPRIVKIFDESALLNGTGASNQFTSLLVATLLREGLYQKHYEEIQIKYRERITFVYNYLKDHLPNGIKISYPRGGCFLWIEFPLEFPGEEFRKYLIEKYHLYVTNGSSYCVNPEKSHNCIRLICTYHDLPTLKVASELFCSSYLHFTSSPLPRKEQ